MNKITKQDIKNIVKNNLWCVSSDRSNMVDVFLDNNKAVSTDGIRLSITAISETGLKHLIPVDIFKNMAKSKYNEWDIVKEGNDIIFNHTIVGNPVLTNAIQQQEHRAKITEEQFPNYEEVIPKEFKLTVNTNKELFLQSLEVIALADEEKAKKVTMIIKPNTMYIQYGTVEIKIPVQHTELENEFKITFDYRFMKQAIKACQNDNIEMYFVDATNPIMISDLIGYQHLLMPVYDKKCKEDKNEV